MADENIENLRKKLIFRSEHRGTKEMDLLLGSFARRHVPEFTPEELRDYEALLQENDPDLYNWITEQETPPDHIQTYSMFSKILGHRYK